MATRDASTTAPKLSQHCPIPAGSAYLAPRKRVMSIGEIIPRRVALS